MAEKKNWFEKKIDDVCKRAKKDKKYKNRMLAVWALILVVWTGAVFYLSQIVVFNIAQFGIDTWHWAVDITVAQTVCMVISYIIALVVLILVPAKIIKMKVSRDNLGLNGLPTWTDILLAPIGYIVSIIVTLGVILLLQAIAPAVDWNQTQNVGYNAVYTNQDRIITFVALVILAPITEELIFRGFLYGKLRSRLSAIPAIIIVSVLFGLMHGQWNVGIVVGIMSIFLCIARELTGTIYAGVLMHMIRNGLAFYLLYVNPMAVPAVSGIILPLLFPFLI